LEDTILTRDQERRKKRCFHRVISGLERAGEVRFITLTSSDQAPVDIQRSFRLLFYRLRRLGVLKDYIKVCEVADDGRYHLHIAFRGSYIDQKLLSNLWNHIHASPIVDIRKLKNGGRHKRAAANYLAKYMSKGMSKRYSWSHHWVYPGFVKVWKTAKHIFAYAHTGPDSRHAFGFFMRLWKAHLHNNSPPYTFITTLTTMFESLNPLNPTNIWTYQPGQPYSTL